MPDRVEQLFEEFMFGDIAGGTGGQCIRGELFAAMRCHHHNRGRSATFSNCPHQLQTVQVGHPHVGEYEIGVIFFDLRDGFGAIDRIENRKLGILFKDTTNQATFRFKIVGN